MSNVQTLPLCCRAREEGVVSHILSDYTYRRLGEMKAHTRVMTETFYILVLLFFNYINLGLNYIYILTPLINCLIGCGYNLV